MQHIPGMADPLCTVSREVRMARHLTTAPIVDPGEPQYTYDTGLLALIGGAEITRFTPVSETKRALIASADEFRKRFAGQVLWASPKRTFSKGAAEAFKDEHLTYQLLNDDAPRHAPVTSQIGALVAEWADRYRAGEFSEFSAQLAPNSFLTGDTCTAVMSAETAKAVLRELDAVRLRGRTTVDIAAGTVRLTVR